MNGRKDPDDELRRRAEEQLRGQHARSAGRDIANPLELVQELEVHRIELETQNEELRRLRVEIEAGLARYTELFDFAPIGYAVVAGDAAIRNLNFAAARLLGRERDQLVGHRLREYVAQPQRRDLLSTLAGVVSQVADERRSRILELTLIRADGESRDVRMTMGAIVNAEPAALVAIEDVTERKRAEALRAEHEVRERLLDATRQDLEATRHLQHIGMLSFPDGSELHVLYSKILDAAISIAGADFGDLQIIDRRTGSARIRARHGLSPWWAEFWEHTEGAGARSAAMRENRCVIIEDIERGGVEDERVLALKRRAGIRGVFATPLRSRAGRTLGALTMYYKQSHQPDDRTVRLIDLLARQAADLIDRVHAEELEALLRRRFEALDFASVTINKYLTEHRGVPMSNELLRELAEVARSVTSAEAAAVGLGNDAEEAMTSWAISDPAGNLGASMTETVNALTRTLAQSSADERSTRHEDAVRTFLGSAIRDHGRLVGSLCIARNRSTGDFDADERLTLEMLADRIGLGLRSVRLAREAQLAIHARENLLAIVSHDLRGPLSAIRLASQMMSRGEASGAGRNVEIVRRSADRMTRLIEDLLQAASIEAGKLAMNISREDVLPIVREGIDACAPMAEDKSIHLHSDIPAGLPSILADRDRLMQVLTNLIGNAIKFSREGADVLVTARVQGEAITFAVADTGPGIPEAEQGRIFERFEQGRSGGRRGVGLGLYIARGIVEAHCGHIWVESQPGTGSTFFFTIPVVPTPDVQLHA